MKGGRYKVIFPVIRLLFRETIAILKPLFLNENKRLKAALSQHGFHPALCAHPSILFESKVAKRDKTICIQGPVIFLKKCIKIGALKDNAVQQYMREFGVQPFFKKDIGYWLDDPHAPIVPYTIPDCPKPEGRIIVYTVLTGDYDNVSEILFKEDGVDYILFTNNPSLKSRTWRVIPIQSDLNDVLLSREVKMLPHKYLNEEYEVSIYVDANVVIYGEISRLTCYLGHGNAFAVSAHSVRKTVKEEINACVKLGKVDGMQAREQYEKYLSEGFKEDQPLLECGILVRKHKDQNLQLLMQNWFNEFRNGIRRDQLSLPPCISRLGYKDYVIMDGSVWHNQFNRLVSHKKR